MFELQKHVIATCEASKQRTNCLHLVDKLCLLLSNKYKHQTACQSEVPQRCSVPLRSSAAETSGKCRGDRSARWIQELHGLGVLLGKHFVQRSTAKTVRLLVIKETLAIRDVKSVLLLVRAGAFGG
jgi:hypothetical protein